MTKPASSQPGTALRWEWRSFDNLDVPTLYALLQLRAAVFVVEQACAFQDLDDLDQPAWHCLGWDGDVLAASQRCLPRHVNASTSTCAPQNASWVCSLTRRRRATR